jgi:hypothetical protein
MDPEERKKVRRKVEWILGIGPARMRASADSMIIHAGIAATFGCAVSGLAAVLASDLEMQLVSILAQGAVAASTLFVWRLRWNRLERSDWMIYERSDD